MEDDEEFLNLLALHDMMTWLIRAAISIPLLAVLAIILKYYLIEPYSANMLEFDVEFESVPLKKGDKENILNYEMRWRMIKEGKELI